MQTIYFTKTFTSGTLKGLSVIGKGYIRKSEDIARYRIGAKGQDCMTRDKWIVTDASFQNYAR
jgi:hypothetical protein